MPKAQSFTSGAILAATGLATALVLSGTAQAGPFQWLTGKNQQQQPPQQYQQPEPPQQQQSGNNPGFFPFFGGARGNRANRGYQAGPDPTAAPRADELPRNDPEAYMITNPPLGTPTLSSRNVAATQAAIQRYQSIAAQGGWPMVPAKAMHPGQRGQEVAALQRRLEVSGDLVGMSVPGEYDGAVVQAVKNFQSRHGLPATGKIDSKAMIEALNVPASIRLAQLQASLKRLQGLSANTGGGRYVVVNVPSAQVEAVEGGEVVSRHAAVVGKPERPTPEITSKVVEINFNPYWYVPRTIIHKDLIPKGRAFAARGQDMLAAYRMQAFDAAGNPLDPRQINWNGTEVYNYNFRQLPQGENSLGFVKINFPNKDAVYLHDTPLKSLFGKAVRFESSGCVRVHNVEQLVAWILRDTPGWNYQRIASMKHTGEQLDVKVPKPVPIYLAYITGWGTPDGRVHFGRDIYGVDGPSTTASAY
ncbi:MAG TPA: L,D-transpeptidase family protein [Methyloceanibacter sp.]|nr:L,D-transpeptidase family protein [Methyloceanibacter sp.]